MEIQQKIQELQNEILSINESYNLTKKRIAELKSLLDEKAKRALLLEQAKAEEAELMKQLGL